MIRWLFASVALFALLYAQQQQPQPTPPPKPEAARDQGVFRLPSQFPEAEQAPKPAEPEAPKKAVLENTGKPMRVPFACTEEDISAFGMTCTIEDPCPVFLELSQVYSRDRRILVTGNLHNGSTTMYSVLLISEDGGKTFEEGFERIKAAGLDQVLFFDADTGWIAGQVLQALPRDPFFLLTLDGGKTWRKRPVSEDPKIGSIERFDFESKTAGTLLVDRGQSAEGARFERYETMTGGDTWMVREVGNRPFAIKAAKAAVRPEWRLQADGKLKAHTIEQRIGERWQRAASFQVQVSECKPMQNPDIAPPPEPEAGITVNDQPVRTAPPRGPSRPPSLKKKN